MKRTKRKYTRKVIPDALESISGTGKEESHISVPPDRVGKPVLDEFSFNDLPLSIRVGVEKILKYRKSKGLPDDSKERKERAIRMFKGDRPR